MSNSRALLSVDFWDTLVKAETGGNKRHKVRHEALCEVSYSYVENLPDGEIEEAHRQASNEFNRIWLNQERTPTTREMVNNILTHLGIPATKKELEWLVRIYEESLLEGPPDLAENVADVLADLQERYTLALISDTMYSPGRVIRNYLESHDLLNYFDDFIFSNETGYSKPNPKAFMTVLENNNCQPNRSFHIGDRLDTDIKGANTVGMNTILFTGFSGIKGNAQTDIMPDHTCNSWRELADLLA